MKRYQFSREAHADFATTLKSRVNQYLKQVGSDEVNQKLIWKSVAAFTMYLLPFVLMLSLGISNLFILFAMWMLMGLGKAFIGTSVMHDALHGSYSKKKTLNNWMGYSTLILGVDPKIWQLQHNVLHHTFTNIEDADDDIAPRFVLRFTPHQKRRWFHRFQHIYAPIFYSISTLLWVFQKDFHKIIQYRDMGLIKPGKEFNMRLLRIIGTKVFYFSIFLGLPYLVLPVSFGMIVWMFISMHAVTGLTLALVFQTAHVMPANTFVKTEETNIDQNFLVHQMETTSNFAMENRLLSWFIGGLNFQIEHHLFPYISHVHYRKISKIVQSTAQEFNIPYLAHRSFRSALLEHFRLLRSLGRGDGLELVKVRN